MLSVKEKIEKAEDYKAKGSALVQEQKYKRAIAKYSTVFAYIKVCCSSVRGGGGGGGRNRKGFVLLHSLVLIVEERVEYDTGRI